jgi:hypothetical protein
MKLLLYLSLIVFASSYTQNISAQAVANDASGVMYLFPNEVRSNNSFRRGVFAGQHIFGDTITYKMNEFEKKYVYFKPGNGAYAVEEKIILKPQIYKSIKKLDTFFEKEFSEGRMSVVVASDRFTKVLDVGLKLINFQTVQVEKDIKKLKDPLALEKYLLSLKFSQPK